MIQLLVSYFIKNGHLDLPSIGSLKWNKQSSFWENNKFIAPKEFIDLTISEGVPTKHFYQFLAEELSVSMVAANKQYDSFIQQFIGENKASLQFGNLGTLHKNQEIYHWENLYNSADYYQDLTLDLAAVNNHQESMTPKKENWWIWAIILTIIAMLMILYKQFYF